MAQLLLAAPMFFLVRGEDEGAGCPARCLLGSGEEGSHIRAEFAVCYSLGGAPDY